MKNRLNITIDDALMEQAKRYAVRHKTSLSQLVEQYFKSLTRPARRKNIIQMIEELPKPTIKVEGDLKEAYYEDKKRNMAFKVSVDANLLLDFTLKRDNYIPARDVMQHGIDGFIQLYTTPAVLHITVHWIAKTYGTAKAKELLLGLLNDVQIIDCDHATAMIAINSSMDDIEDALQYYTALKFGMEYFISADKKLKKAAIPQLPVYTADELLAELKPDE